jgi:hypothetical protein
VVGRVAGTRLLTIIGASHKGYLKAYRKEMHNIRIVDVSDALK